MVLAGVPVPSGEREESRATSSASVTASPIPAEICSGGGEEGCNSDDKKNHAIEKKKKMESEKEENAGICTWCYIVGVQSDGYRQE